MSAFRPLWQSVDRDRQMMRLLHIVRGQDGVVQSGADREAGALHHGL